MAWARWDERAARPDDSSGIALLDALFGNSPYLTETALQNPGFMTDLWRRGPDAVMADLTAEVASVQQDATGGAVPDDIAARLRRLKRRVALGVAVADIADAWPLERITGELSDFASRCLRALTEFHTAPVGARRAALPRGRADAAAFTVLGMGKLGAGELNYSSDIDSSFSTTAMPPHWPETSSCRGISSAPPGCWSS